MSNQVQEFKVIENPRWEPVLALLGLFLPMPAHFAKYTPDYVVNGWGFSYTIAISRWKIPFGVIMIIIAILF